MPDGFLLDAYSDPERDEIVLWLKTLGGGAVRLAERFTPHLHVRARNGASLGKLVRDLAALPHLGEPVETEGRCGLEDEPSRVLRVPVLRHAELMRTAQAVDSFGGHRDLELFDVDLRMSHRYFLRKGLWPFVKMRAWTHGRYRLLEESLWSIEYERPGLRVVELGAEPRAAPGEIPTHATPLRRAWVREEESEPVVLEGAEETTLAALGETMARLDPDVVLTKGGDSFLLPWLRARAEANGLRLQLGREPDPARPRKAAKSHFSYGKIKHQPEAHALRGRIHVDRESSFFHREAGLDGLLDLARVCRIPMQDLARLGAGTALTAIQVDLAASQGRLVPWKKSVPERWKSAHELLLADRGGHVMEPRVGLHEDVVEHDFASMYPNLMVNHNISPETIGCSCCDPATLPYENVTPQTGSWTCARREGFIPTYIRRVVERREHFKRMRKRDPERRARYQAIADTYKWLNVTSFGYQGYRNAKFGAIECHEAISAWGRETLLSAAEIARDLGWEWLHGIVDSLWLKRVAPGADPSDLEEAISRELGIRFEHQGRYKWIVFLPNRRDPARPGAPAVGALTRYYGCFDRTPDKPSRSQAGQPVDHLAGGALKVRGVELRQHSTPPLLREVQERFLDVVARADDAAGFLRLLPDALEASRSVLERVLDGEARPSDLLFTVAVTRAADEYRSQTCAAAALRALARRGHEVPPGDVVRYVITDMASRDPERKVVEARLMRGGEEYDREAYARLVLRSVASLALPFGLDEETLAARWLAGRTRLDAWNIEA